MWNILAEAAGNESKWLSYVLIGVLLVAVIAMFALSGRKNKQRQQEYMEQLAAIRPGHKVKTAGGICGIVVEVCDEDNTVIIETGSEQSGKSYIKMDKELIAQTDAKGATQLAREAAAAAKQAEKDGAPVEENAPQEEAPAEEAPAEEAAPVEEKEEK
ncbi:MAG: preprotein translocase subunit YajC [Clostridia bacterium]|nr:preprotein translocase subunit YajC [Clostridia bacterium]